MGFRDKLSKKFGSKKNGSGDSTPGSNSPPKRKGIEYYKPNEIPKSKYRGKVDPAHKDKLDSYSLGGAFTALRRKSSQALSGTFSPGGTAQSRRGSWMSRAKFGVSTSSLDSEPDARSLRRKSVASAGVPKEAALAENDEDDKDIFNTGISGTVTASGGSFKSNGGVNIPQISLERTITAGNPSSPSAPHGSPFTIHELEQAMTRASTRPRRGTVIASAIQPEAIAA